MTQSLVAAAKAAASEMLALVVDYETALKHIESCPKDYQPRMKEMAKYVLNDGIRELLGRMSWKTTHLEDDL